MAREIIRPCAACKHQHRRCDITCDLAPYYPADNPQRYNLVHSVFGRRNVSRMLQEIDVVHRQQAADALVYEAEARLRDPIHGCLGPASIHENRLKEVQENLQKMKNELAKYLSPEIIQFVLSNRDLFGLAPNNNQDPQGNHVSEQPSTELTAIQQHNLGVLKQMSRMPGGGGGEGQHFSFHVPVGYPISAVMAPPSFDNGGTSTTVYQTQLQSSQGQHFSFNVPVGAPISAVMAPPPSFDNGGTSTTVYQTQLQSSQGQHSSFHVPVGAPISAVMAPSSFDNGGTSTSVYQAQLQSSQKPPH